MSEENEDMSENDASVEALEDAPVKKKMAGKSSYAEYVFSV